MFRLDNPLKSQLEINRGGEGENRTHIAGFSDRCRDQLGYLT
jgi:hypothetical protein